jgi:hypothetical protein
MELASWVTSTPIALGLHLALPNDFHSPACGLRDGTDCGVAFDVAVKFGLPVLGIPFWCNRNFGC